MMASKNNEKGYKLESDLEGIYKISSGESPMQESQFE
jgi:hypothetical protein